MPLGAQVDPRVSAGDRRSPGLGNWRLLFLIVAVTGGVDCSFPSHTFVSFSDVNTGGTSSGGVSTNDSVPDAGTAPTTGGATVSDSPALGGNDAAGSTASFGGTAVGGGALGGTSGLPSGISGNAGNAVGGTYATNGGTAGSTDTTTTRAGNTSAPTEICSNRIDDNGDGKIDCEDPTCGNWGCLPAIPSGWSGPVVVGARPTPTSDLSCNLSGGYPTAVTARWCSSLSSASYRCGSCASCGNATGVSVTTQVTYTRDCNGSLCSDPSKCSFKIDESCQPTVFEANWLGTDPKTMAIAVSPVSVSGGTCPGPSQPADASPPDGGCTQLNQVCRTGSTGSCNLYEGGLCLPKPASSFGSKVCIYSETADGKCPKPWDGANSAVYWGETNDSRHCADCTCSLPNPSEYPTASGMVSAYSSYAECLAHGSSPSGVLYTDGSTTCSGRLNPTFPSGVDTRYIALWFAAGAVPSVACHAGGGNPVGKVDGTSPVTVCCMEPAQN